jgi:putative tricarboxylic transport membrane protein
VEDAVNTERLGGFFWLAFGLFIVVGSIELGLGTLKAPGSGFLSFSAGIVVLILSSLVLFQSFKGGKSSPRFAALWKAVNWHRPMMVSLLMIFYILSLERLGFFITSFVALFLLFRWVEKASWRKSTLIPFSVTVFAYLLFHTMLKATLPEGIFGF